MLKNFQHDRNTVMNFDHGLWIDRAALKDKGVEEIVGIRFRKSLTSKYWNL
jgi:hypothetical protein